MHFVILFLLFSSISIRKISGDKPCPEQQCVSNVSQWCCPYNTTCGNQNTCNHIKQARNQIYCPDKLACFLEPYYWCCDSSQTCGGFRECEGDNTSTLAIIVIFSTIGVAILITICGMYMRRRWLRNNNDTQTVSLPNDNQGLPSPFYVLTNNSISGIDSHGQFSNISPPLTTFSGTEEPPPSYNAALAPSTTENPDKV